MGDDERGERREAGAQLLSARCGSMQVGAGNITRNVVAGKERQCKFGNAEQSLFDI